MKKKRPELSIRPMRKTDAAQVARLVCALAETQGSQAKTKAAHVMKAQKRYGNTILVAILEKKIIGYVLGSVRYNLEYASEEWTMDYLYVHEDFQGTGIGSKLVQALAQKAQKSRVACMRTAAMKNNKRAARLYESLGFSKRPENHYRFAMRKDTIQKLATRASKA